MARKRIRPSERGRQVRAPGPRLSLASLSVLLAIGLYLWTVPQARHEAPMSFSSGLADPAQSGDVASAREALQRVAGALGLAAQAVELDERLSQGAAYADADTIRVSPALARNESLLRYVLAHEFAHQALGHTRLASLARLPADVLRQREFDADAQAVSHVCSQGSCDVEVFARFLETTPEGPEHPAGAERAARVRALGRAWLALDASSLRLGFAPVLHAPAEDSFLAKSQPR